MPQLGSCASFGRARPALRQLGTPRKRPAHQAPAKSLLQKAADSSCVFQCRFSKSLATPDPIPEEGQKRALELMKSGALFRYTPGVESETALARAAVSIKRPRGGRQPIFGPPGLGGGRARLLAREERALILTLTLTLTLRRRSGT